MLPFLWESFRLTQFRFKIWKLKLKQLNLSETCPNISILYRVRRYTKCIRKRSDNWKSVYISKRLHSSSLTEKCNFLSRKLYLKNCLQDIYLFLSHCYSRVVAVSINACYSTQRTLNPSRPTAAYFSGWSFSFVFPRCQFTVVVLNKAFPFSYGLISVTTLSKFMSVTWYCHGNTRRVKNVLSERILQNIGTVKKMSLARRFYVFRRFSISRKSLEIKFVADS